MLLIILGLAFFLGIMLLAVILSLSPNLLRINGKFVCKNGEKMEIFFSRASHHQPGERSIEIYCNDYGKKRDVKLKTLLLSFLFAFMIMLPLAVFIVIFAARFFEKID